MAIINIYNAIGQEDGIRKLVDTFYDFMDTLQEAKGIRLMHPEELSSSRQKLFEFLSGWSGGPQLFMEKHGHPRLRMRHAPFPIGVSERDQWMLCMNKALEICVENQELKELLATKFYEIADFMRNIEG